MSAVPINRSKKKYSSFKIKKNWGGGKFDYFKKEGKNVDYKDVNILKKFTNRQGRIVNRFYTKLSSKNQRKISKAIKRARNEGLLPYTIVDQNEGSFF